MRNRRYPGSLWTSKVFLSFLLLAVCFLSGVVAVMDCVSLLTLYIGVCAIQGISDPVFQRQWLLTARVLLSSIENVAAGLWWGFFTKVFFQSKSIIATSETAWHPCGHEWLLAPGTCENLIPKEVSTYAHTRLLVTDWPKDCLQFTLQLKIKNICNVFFFALL